MWVMSKNDMKEKKKVEKSCMSNSVKEEISGKNANGRVRWWIKRRSCKNLCIRGRLFSLFFYSVLLESFSYVYSLLADTQFYFIILHIHFYLFFFGVHDKVVKCQNCLLSTTRLNAKLFFYRWSTQIAVCHVINF